MTRLVPLTEQASAIAAICACGQPAEHLRERAFNHRLRARNARSASARRWLCDEANRLEALADAQALGENTR